MCHWLIAASAVGCGATSNPAETRHVAIAVSTRVDPHDPPRTPTGLGPLSATISLLGLTCRPDEHNNHIQLWPDAGALQLFCDGKALGAWVDEAGIVGPLGSFSWAVPGMRRGDIPMRFRLFGTKRWLALEDNTDEAGQPQSSKTVFLVNDVGRWTVVPATGRGAHQSVIGLGPWSGGAIIAAVRAPWPPGRPWIEVIDGTAGAPLPVFPEDLGHEVDFESSAWGEAFGAADRSGEDGGVVLLHWRVGQAQPDVEVLPQLKLSSRMPGGPVFRIRSSTEVYLAAETGVGSPDDFVRVLRFDGARWTTSTTFARARGPRDMILGPDGALWVLIDAEDDDGGWTEIWRRRPGEGDQWQQVAPDLIGHTSTLRARGIMGAGRSDLLVAAELDGTGWGLYRLQVSDRER